MSFVPFKRPGEQFSDRVSIWKTAILAVSAGAVRRFGLEGVTHCQLSFNKETNRIGILFVEPDFPGALKLHWRTSGFLIPAKSFMDCHGIDYARTQSFILSWSPSTNFAQIALDQDTVQSEDPAVYAEEAVASLELFLEKASMLPKSIESRAKMVKILYGLASQQQMDRWQLCEALLNANDSAANPEQLILRSHIETLLWAGSKGPNYNSQASHVTT